MIALIPKSDSEYEKTFIKHMTKDPWWKDDIKEIQKKTGKIVIGSTDIVRSHGNRLICPKCERGAYRHGSKKKARCNICGWEGRSVTVDEYITEKLYRR